MAADIPTQNGMPAGKEMRGTEMKQEKHGVLLVNLRAQDKAPSSAVKRYLKEFLR
ncbi:hypothetical protein M8494_20320 [Serratia ureilytica]